MYFVILEASAYGRINLWLSLLLLLSF